jgi:hypothetical protein
MFKVQANCSNCSFLIRLVMKPDSASPVGAGKIWTIEGVHGDAETASLDEEDTKLLLLEKEFEDFYEDQVSILVFPWTYR